MAITHGSTTVMQFCATQAGSYVAAAGLDTALLNATYNLLDANTFADAMIKRRIAGLKDWTIDVSGWFEVDATSQGLVRSLGRTSAAVFWKLLYDGTNGYSCAASTGCLVDSWTINSNATDTVKFSGKLVCSGEDIAEVGTAD